MFVDGFYLSTDIREFHYFRDVLHIHHDAVLYNEKEGYDLVWIYRVTSHLLKCINLYNEHIKPLQVHKE